MPPQVTFILTILLSPAITISPTVPPSFVHTTSTDVNFDEEYPFTLLDSEGNKAKPGHLGLLLYHDGTVCGNSFNKTAADAICKCMGYTSATGWTSQVESFEIRYGFDIKMSDVQCSRADWNDCNFTEEHDCVHTHDVFLSCNYQLMHGESKEESTVFTLVDSNGDEIEEIDTYRGGLLLYRGGTVCSDTFDDLAANAICSYMGYNYAYQWEGGKFFPDVQDDMDINLSKVACSSTDWETCSFSEEPNCDHSQDVFLACFGREETEDETDDNEQFPFSLVDSEGNEVDEGEGLLLYRGGTVCDDGFNEIAAEAICRYMEYSYSTGWTSEREITEFRERLEIKLDDVECSSADWNSCTFSEENDCSHGEDVFLSCSYGEDAGDDSDFKLVDAEGNEVEEGEGLLLYRGGTVCDGGFNEIAAEAICRYMGYSYSTGWTSEREITEFRGRLDIKLDDVECSKADWNSCNFSEKNDCSHGEDVFLSCSYGEDAGDASDFKLVDAEGNEIEEGEGLLLYRGGTVCDDGFNDIAAEAICKGMGYTQSLDWGSGFRFSIQDQYSINLDDVECSNAKWEGCTFLAYDHNCGHGEDIFLDCGTSAYWLTIGDRKIKMFLLYKYEL